VQTSLLDHLESVGFGAHGENATGFMFEPCPLGMCGVGGDRLIAELKPVCNRP
jgi:hypothetical protein